MLSGLRQNRENIVIKVLLGLIALMFIIYFGSDTVRQFSTERNEESIEVNGVTINSRAVNYYMALQRQDFISRSNQEPPEELLPLFRQQAASTLIRRELQRQDVKRLGLATAAEELKEVIRSNPNFQRNGVFDADLYRNKHLKRYLKQMGTPYEYDLRDDLALAKISSRFADVFHADEDLLKKRHRILNTKYKFSVIKVPVMTESPDDLLPKDLKGNKTVAENRESSQKELANSIWEKWRTGKNIDDVLSEHKLKIRTTPALTPEQLSTVLDGQESMAELKMLAGLTKSKPFPESVLKIGDKFYLIKLDELTLPPATPTDDEIAEFKNAYVQENAGTLDNAWVVSLAKKAEISTGK